MHALFLKDNVKAKMVEILFDNGGGITIQCTGYAHYYLGDAQKAASDFEKIIQGADPKNEWDGHDESAFFISEEINEPQEGIVYTLKQVLKKINLYLDKKDSYIASDHGFSEKAFFEYFGLVE